MKILVFLFMTVVAAEADSSSPSLAPSSQLAVSSSPASLQNPEANQTAPATPSPATPASKSVTPTSIPSTIKTLSGKTYTDCTLSRVMPDGISFTHSMGVAKILFTDLDPAFSATFGYDPAKAEKYEEDEAQREKESDAARAAATAAASPPSPPADGSDPAPASPAALTDEQRSEMEARVDWLEKDIAFMKREEEKVPAHESFYSETHAYTQGAYADKIIEEKNELADLQAKLK